MSDPRLDAHLAILTAAVERYLIELRRRWSASSRSSVDAEVARVTGGIGARSPQLQDGIDEARALLAAADPGPLGGIAAALALSTGEELLVSAAWWAEADPQLAIALGCAHDDSARRYASAGLLRLLLEPWGMTPPATLDDGCALVTEGVLEPGAGAAGPLRLTPTARLLLAGQAPHQIVAARAVPPRFAPALAALARRLERRQGGVVVLRGPAGVGRTAVACQSAAAAGLPPVSAGGRPAAELRLLGRTGTAVPVVPAADVGELGWSEHDGPLIVIAGPGESVADAYVVELPGPGFEERLALWRATLAGECGDGHDRLAAMLATRFVFTDGAIDQVMARARAEAEWQEQALSPEHVWEAARRRPEHALDRLAALVAPAFTLDDLVLAPERSAQLRELIAHVELQHVVLDGWGFRRRMPRGQGVIALFTGPSGTGKTTAAEAVAHALRQDLYRIDLSAVVSKYVGETEKNLAAAFDEAERAGAVLFFDEADSLFGKRTEIKDAHDRYANLEVNYLLQRIETFTGLVLLATNRRSALDEAFARRLRFVIRFEHPDHELRAALWRRSFPPETALDGLDWDELAVPELSGGSIQSAALSAAYLAAANGGTVTRAHVEHALRREHEKLGKAFAGLFGEDAR